MFYASPILLVCLGYFAQSIDGFSETLTFATSYMADCHVKEASQGKLVRWAIEGLYRGATVDVPADLAARLERESETPDEIRSILSDARRRLGDRPSLRDAWDIDMALRGILEHLEPGIEREPGRVLQPWFGTVHYTYHIRIGAKLCKDPRSDYIQVVTPFKNGPLHRAGIRSGDVILSFQRLDGPDRKVLSTSGLTVEQVNRSMCSNHGFKSKLTIRREGVPNPLDVVITHEKSEPETVLGYRRKHDDNADWMLDKSYRIGYLRMDAIRRQSPAEFTSVLTGLEKQGMRGMVLDLRFCPGGLLPAGFEIADLLIDDGLICSVYCRFDGQPNYFGRSEGSHLGFPVVCLVNGSTSSTSEVLAACLQDHKRAVIVGERTAGKAAVQTLQSVGPRSDTLPFVTAVLRRPSGINLAKMMTSGKETDHWGVVPDEGCKLALSADETKALEEHLRLQEVIPRRDLPATRESTKFVDRQLELALSILRDKLSGGKP